MEEHAATMEPFGVLFEDNFSAPPTAAVAAAYNQQLNIFEFVADEEQITLEYIPSGALPHVFIIDTDDMEIVYLLDDYDLWEIIDVANALP